MKTSIKYKEIWKIAYPIILGSIVQNIISITDTAFLGRVGEIELGAAAIGGVFYLTLIMLGFGFSIGSQIIVARRFGENNNKQIGVIIEHSHYFLIVLAILIISVMQWGMHPIFDAVLKSDNIRVASVSYFQYRIFGLFFAFINYGFRAFYIGIARTRIISLTTVFMAIANVFFDYALIFGNFGFPELGISGAAIASIIAEVSAMIFFIFFTLRFVDLKFFNLFRFKKFDFGILRRIFTVAFPMMMQNFISFTGWFFFFLFVEKMGERPLAISNVIRSIYVVMLIPIWGFTSATNTLVSFLIGRERKDEVIPLILKILKICIVGVAGLVLLNMLFPKVILSIYTNNQILIQEALPTLYVVSIAALFLTVGFVFFSGVSGTGMTRISFLIETSVMVFYVLYTYLMVNLKSPKIEFVWTVEIMYGSIIAIISFFYMRFGKWQDKKI
ncbi:MAG TPA: MATE family efflux transporter [Bacteroidales bacterium]|nr:MATE family efflux transporter [Bacteroidales bacterium]